MKNQTKQQTMKPAKQHTEKQTWQKLILQKLILITSTLAMLTILGGLSGCASNNLNAPCPNYGAYCTKTPMNSWDTNDA